MKPGKTSGDARAMHGFNDRSLHMETIVAQHETALLRYAGRIVNDSTAAQDVVQNVFIKLFRNWNGQAPAENLKGWLYRVTHNEAVDHVRRESRLRVLHTRHGEESDVIAPPAPPVREQKERTLAVLRHLGQLPPDAQQVVLLRLQEGLSYKEIARVTGRSVGNVGNILHRAVKKLAKAVKQDDLS
jgi:RNA polymerase sigma-70 factor (ECF subfamily)